MEVVKQLAHHQGVVFFDTAGNLPGNYPAPRSLIAAGAREILVGRLEDAQDLQRLIQAHDLLRAAGQGALCGWVTYEGEYTFGLFPEVLTYDHASGSWEGSSALAGSMDTPGNPPPPRLSDFRPLTEPQAFLDSVQRAKEWIAAGDIYQVNLSQAFEAGIEGGHGLGLYEALRRSSPAPLAAYLSLAGREVLSSSPETFLRISGSRIETRPIKGTRPRYPDAVSDARSAAELLGSDKERAELVMITDLLRNDLGQVCEFGSVEVVEMLRLETLAQVHHLVSTVVGTLRPGVGPVEALAACFPGGSITGAPKKRAMEIIRELEPVPRGIYCGAIGYLGFDGDAQFSIAIRTMVREGSRARYHVGAGIVADSVPSLEYQETLHKAAGIRQAIEAWQNCHFRQ
jgi:para-aminobenzoate synthetase component I